MMQNISILVGYQIVTNFEKEKENSLFISKAQVIVPVLLITLVNEIGKSVALSEHEV